jgi:uncharacterized circularly permuted ATP-grasp superfamily protein
MSDAAQQQDAPQTNDELIDIYVKLRDRVAEIEKEFGVRTAPIKTAMSSIETVLHKRLIASDTEAFKTASGTAFMKEQTSITTKEWATETLPFIIANQRWELLDAGVNKTAALAHMEANGGALVPGTKYSSRMVVQIRRGKDKE